MLVFVEEEKSESPEKYPRSKDENQKQTDPRMALSPGIDSGPCTLVGGECSYNCAILLPTILTNSSFPFCILYGYVFPSSFYAYFGPNRVVLNCLSKVILQLLWFCNASFCDGLKFSRHFLNQSKVKPKLIVRVTCLHEFSRAWRRLNVFTSSSDWFIEFSASVVIGHSNYFGFRFMTLD